MDLVGRLTRSLSFIYFIIEKVGGTKMIEKDKVLHVINEHALLRKESEGNEKEISDFSLDDIVRSEEERQLHSWIEALSQDERIDLVALMDCGRIHWQKGDMQANYEEFITCREGIAITFEVQEPSHIANYLIGTMQLSVFLRYALPLYDEIKAREAF